MGRGTRDKAEAGRRGRELLQYHRLDLAISEAEGVDKVDRFSTYLKVELKGFA